MMHDPQNDPEFYANFERTLTDVDGVDLRLMVDQDGEEFVVDEREERERRWEAEANAY